MKPKLIVIFGRRWFDKTNTYHDAEIIVHGSGKKVIRHRTSMEYGYGESYIQTASLFLNDQKIVSLVLHNNGSYQPLWQYCRDNEIALITSAVDVHSRKDLKIESK